LVSYWLRSKQVGSLQVSALCSQNPGWELLSDGGGCDSASSPSLLPSWPQSTVLGLNRAKFCSAGLFLQQGKQVHMAGYLFELVFEMNISPRHYPSQTQILKLSVLSSARSDAIRCLGRPPRTPRYERSANTQKSRKFRTTQATVVIGPLMFLAPAACHNPILTQKTWFCL
jgi:hypothetical protein